MLPRLHAIVRRHGDALLGGAVVTVALVEFFAPGSPAAAWGGKGAAELLLALASTVPLVWRSRFPVLVALGTTLSSGLLVVLAAPHQGPFTVFVADVLAAYSLGAHTGGRRGYRALAGLFAVGIPFSVLAAARGTSPGNVVPSIVWILGAWAVGRIIRGRRERTHELEVLTGQLQAQRELQAEAAVAVERGRIARELHDVIAHNVSMIVVQAAAAARVLRGDEPDVRTALAAIESTGRQTVDEMRRMLGIVRAPDSGASLAPQPTLHDVERLVETVSEAGLPVDLRIEGSPVALPPGVDLSAYRIVQEALTNALKHAGEARATVTVRYRADAVEVEIVDDGRGLGTGGGTGNGLIGMRERVALWGGELEAGRRDGGGFVVRAQLPATVTA